VQKREKDFNFIVNIKRFFFCFCLVSKADGKWKKTERTSRTVVQVVVFKRLTHGNRHILILGALPRFFLKTCSDILTSHTAPTSPDMTRTRSRLGKIHAGPGGPQW
jgi:hypothetical protein